MTENQQPAQDGSPATAIEIRTVNLTAANQVAVVLDFGGKTMLLTSDAAAQIALELLSAAYAARAEMALNEKLAELKELDETDLYRRIQDND